MRELPTVETVETLRAAITGWRELGQTIALVPTMGALHRGHLGLGRLARRHADRVVFTIFVNPIQFGPREDFASYARTEDADRALLAADGVDLLFRPSAGEMYPEGFATRIAVEGVTEMLCGASRPGHFSGVATVVTKLLLQALPDVAVFGEKDYQQLVMIRRVARDLDIPVRILGAPTMREADGLAMSSRNAYLSAEHRRMAPLLARTLKDAEAKLMEGGEPGAIIEHAKSELSEGGFEVEYLELRSAEDLTPVQALDRPARLFAAARLGRTRLIDNIPVG